MPMAAPNTPLPYLNPDLAARARAADLVSRMTLDEKVSQMVHTAPAIERLGVPAYNWWNECLHGVGRAGIATVFPQAIGLAATFDTDLMRRVGTAISDEARAKHSEALRRSGHSDQYHGLTFWSPNINIFRDPRWGRGQETYGEDPFLTARMGVAFVKALQGDHPRYLKLVATPKHFAVHSGPEKDRHGFDARVNQRDLRETYLYAFRACVKEAHARSIMPAYNRTNGEPCGASVTLLQKILREEWGFDGYVVSDCGAISDIYLHHGIVRTAAEAAALAVHNGCDLNCGDTYCALADAVGLRLIEEAEIDRALIRLFEARMRLGMFDAPARVPYASIPIEVNDCEAHRALALEAAERSIVLLKNGGVLPVAAGVRKIAVIGPNADDVETLLGNYNGTPSRATTPLAGIKARAAQAGIAVTYKPGCAVAGGSEDGFDAAVASARDADLVVMVLGLSPRLEGEEGEANLIDKGGDRVDIGLPAIQERLLQQIVGAGKPVVVVLQGGSALAVPWADEHAAAILMTWYGGEEAGQALARVLWGDVNPSGRLPVTVYRSLDQVPPFADYSMEGRTYRFLRKKPLYPFGHGLSYTQFAYEDLRVSPANVRPGGSVSIEVTVRNLGERDGDEIVQLYLTDNEASVPVPIRQLRGIHRITLKAGKKRHIAFRLTPEQMVCYRDDGTPMVEPGTFTVSVGGGQPGTGVSCAQGGFRLIS